MIQFICVAYHWQSSMNHYLWDLYLWNIILIIVCKMILHSIRNIIIKTCSMLNVHCSRLNRDVYCLWHFFLYSFLWLLFSIQYEFRWRFFAMKMMRKYNICYHIIYPIWYSLWKPISFADTIFPFTFFFSVDGWFSSKHCSTNKSAINI